MKKIVCMLLALAMLLAVSACAKEEEPEYMEIVDTEQFYSFAMSRLGGIILIPVVSEIQSVTFTCDNGYLYDIFEEQTDEAKQISLTEKQIEAMYEHCTISWMPDFEDMNDLNEDRYAVIEIEAAVQDEKKYYQKLIVNKEGITFSLIDSKDME